MRVDPQLPESPPTEVEMRQARESSRALSRILSKPRSLRFTTDDEDAITLEIPAAAVQVLAHLLAEMADGNAVTLMPIHAELTTQRVADLLGVSRPFVVKEIEAGRLPARKVGTHRRVLFKDLAAYRRRSERGRQAALDELAELDQELGLI
jgi:excisionase family DNA binding protein